MAKLTLGHGSGGRLTNDLVKKIVQNFTEGTSSGDMEDCAILPNNVAVTIDGFTISPRTFPGGNIGKLAICGGTNDLAVRGVKPQFISMSVIAEEGFDEDELLGYMKSASSVCSDIGVKLVAGDTKVVPKNSVEGLFMTISSIGTPAAHHELGMHLLQPGDLIAVTTSVGRHGATIGAQRFGLEAKGLKSDCAPLWPALKPLLDLEGLRCMRDCTRGGLGTTLCEWAEGRHIGIEIEEERLPIDESVRSICDILGFDPIYLACEGCAAVAFAPEARDEVLRRLHSSDICSQADIIGEVVDTHSELVGMRTSIGGMRIVDMPVGEMLPRIC